MKYVFVDSVEICASYVIIMWYLGVNLAVSQSQHVVSLMKSYCLINCDLHIICIVFVCLTIVYLHRSIFN